MASVRPSHRLTDPLTPLLSAGYLHTNYSNRPLQEVLDQIDIWLAPGQAGYGDQIQGVWVNQVPPAAKTAAVQKYYDAIAERIRCAGRH